MQINDLVEMAEKRSKGEITVEDVEGLRKFLEGASKDATKIILQGVSEERLTQIRSLVKSVIIASMVAEGDGGARVLFALDSEFSTVVALLDTFLLAMVGIMMQEEIL